MQDIHIDRIPIIHLPPADLLFERVPNRSLLRRGVSSRFLSFTSDMLIYITFLDWSFKQFC